jgi:hypothetical protein
MANDQEGTGALEAKREWVQRVLKINLSGTVAASVTAGISPVTLGKSILLWRKVVTKGWTDLRALRGKIVDAMHANDDMQAEDYKTVESNLYLLDAVSERLNESLIDDLTDLQNAPVDQRAAAIGKVQSRLQEYLTFVDSNPILGLLASNEFLPLNTKSELSAALSGIKAAIAA